MFLGRAGAARHGVQLLTSVLKKMQLAWDDDVLWVTPPSGLSDLEAMRRCREQLRDAINAQPDGARVRLLFDLRYCTLTLAALHFTVRTLLKNEAYMRARLERSAALMASDNRAVKPLVDLFLRIYTPVRPFRVETDVAAARVFVGGKSATLNNNP